MDLLAVATPFIIDHQQFTILSASDISNEKRRAVLESIFFHDVLNSPNRLLGFSELLKEAEPTEQEEYTTILHDLTVEVTEQIQAQRELVKAENSEIAIEPAMLHSLTELQSVASSYRRNPLSNEKSIVIDSDEEDFIFVADKILIKGFWEI